MLFDKQQNSMDHTSDSLCKSQKSPFFFQTLEGSFGHNSDARQQGKAFFIMSLELMSNLYYSVLMHLFRGVSRCTAMKIECNKGNLVCCIVSFSFIVVRSLSLLQEQECSLKALLYITFFFF